MIVLSSLVKTFAVELYERYGDHLLPGHENALHAMARCRTAQSPVFLAGCPSCGSLAVLPHSCGHRSCPHCQHQDSQRWLQRQRERLLPARYFMVTFTLPAQLRTLVWRHQRTCYDLLLKLAWQTLRTFALNDPRLQGKIGAHAVLHTHSRSLDFHPHVHFIVPAGALTKRLWRRKRGRYLFNQDNLAKVFRAKWLQAMQRNGLSVRDTLPGDWVVDCRHVGAGDKALTYLGKYLYRGVLQEKNITSCDGSTVTFRFTDNSGQLRTRTLNGADFLWLLLLHVLPRRFRRARTYGLLHANCKILVTLLQLLCRCRSSPPGTTPRQQLICRRCQTPMTILVTRLPPMPDVLQEGLHLA